MLYRKTHRLSDIVRNRTRMPGGVGRATALALLTPLVLAACEPAEESVVAEDIAQSERPTLATPDTGDARTETRSEVEVPRMTAGESDLHIPAEDSVEVGGVATLEPTEGHSAEGEVRLRPQGDRMIISGTVSGLQPGPHGFHVHENGDCSAPDASSAGGHFAPADDPHGSPTEADSLHHVGDMGNLVANENGVARFEFVDTEMTLGHGPKSVVGKAVVIHAGKDDLVSQPSGDSGDRVACGVIRAADMS